MSAADKKETEPVTFRNPRNASAFTMVELLVVIAVIGVLIGIAVIAFRGIDPSAKTTRATLHTAASLLAEFQAGGGDVKSLPGGTTNATTRARVGADQPQRKDAIEDTRLVMVQLLRVPANQSTMAKLPSQAVLGAKDPTDTRPDNQKPATPVPLDAWGNPVIFVPASGLNGIDLSNSANQTIRSPDGRAFFASAGPDGIFTDPDHTDISQNGYKAFGDDNVYSFQN